MQVKTLLLKIGHDERHIFLMELAFRMKLKVHHMSHFTKQFAQGCRKIFKQKAVTKVDISELAIF